MKNTILLITGFLFISFTCKSADSSQTKTEIVNTGIDIIKITALDEEENNFCADFYLWCR